MTATARGVAEHLLASSPAIRALGAELVAATDEVELAFTVRSDQVNAQAICQGGVLFGVADAAAAMVALADGEAAVTVSADIQYLAPARLGDRIHATSRLVLAAGRTRIVLVQLTRPADEVVICVMRATFRSTGAPVPSGATPEASDV